MFKGVAGRVLKVAVEAFEPYVIERKNIGGEVEYGGFLSGEVWNAQFSRTLLPVLPQAKLPTVNMGLVVGLGWRFGCFL